MSEEYRNEIIRLFESVKCLHKASTERVFTHVIELENFVINEYLNGTNNRNADDYLDGFYAGDVTAGELVDALAFPKEIDSL